MSKYVLGISGSPRKGANTDYMLAVTLNEIAKNQDIKTESLYLRDYNIHPCAGCFACCNKPGEKSEVPCIPYGDDGMKNIYPKLKACDALIIATPVYFGSLTAQTKAFMDRTEGLLRYGSGKYKNALRNKIGAGIAVGAQRNGGQEFTLQAIHYYFLVQDMIIVGAGPDLSPGCYLGGVGSNSPQRGKVKNAVQSDDLGIRNCCIIGRRIVEMLK